LSALSNRGIYVEKMWQRTMSDLCAETSTPVFAVQEEIKRVTFLQPPPTELTCARVVHLHEKIGEIRNDKMLRNHRAQITSVNLRNSPFNSGQ
jgi:hypothetical protein